MNSSFRQRKMLFREFTVVACEVVSHMKVVCYGQLCAVGCIYYTEDDLLKVRDHAKCAQARPVNIDKTTQRTLTARLCTDLSFLICISMYLSHTLET